MSPSPMLETYGCKYVLRAFTFFPVLIFLSEISIAGGIDSLAAERYYTKADSFYAIGKQDSAKYYFEKSVAQFEKIEIWDRYFIAVADLVFVCAELNLTSYGLEAAQTNLLLLKNKIGNQYPILYAKMYNARGAIYSVIGEYDLSIADFLTSLEYKILAYGKTDKEIAKSYNNLAANFRMKGDYDKSFYYFEESIKIIEKIHDADWLFLSVIFNGIGVMFMLKNDYIKAIEYISKANKLTNNQYQNATNNMNLGNIYFQMHEFELSLTYLFLAEKGFINTVGENHFRTSMVYNNIGNTYLNLKQFPKAYSYLQKAITIKINLGINDLNIVHTYNNFANYYYGITNTDSCNYYLDLSYQILKMYCGPKHPEIGNYYFEKAESAPSDSTLYYCQKSIIAFVRDFENTDNYSNPSLNKWQQNITEAVWLLRSLEFKAVCLFQRSHAN